METGSDDSALALAPHVHVGFTMEQAQAHYSSAMAEVQPKPMLVFEQVQEEHRYNKFLLE